MTRHVTVKGPEDDETKEFIGKIAEEIMEGKPFPIPVPANVLEHIVKSTGTHPSKDWARQEVPPGPEGDVLLHLLREKSFEKDSATRVKKIPGNTKNITSLKERDDVIEKLFKKGSIEFVEMDGHHSGIYLTGNGRILACCEYLLRKEN
jgi:hypothetical protein